jgi:ATP-dependent RNA circularization protein (DNA/RNA ligase family)
VSWYRESAWNKFYAFDILNLDTGKFYPTDIRVQILDEFEIEQVPPLCKMNGPLVTEEATKQLDWYANNNKFLIDDKDKVGEGIVIKGFDKDGEPFVNKYGRTQWAKVVRQEFKEKNYIKMGAPEKLLKVCPEELFVEEYITSGRVEKIKQKILDDKGTGWRSQYIQELLSRVYHDAFTEELWKFVKKNKSASMNFKVLNRLCIIKTKKLAGI